MLEINQRYFISSKTAVEMFVPYMQKANNFFFNLHFCFGPQVCV